MKAVGAPGSALRQVSGSHHSGPASFGAASHASLPFPWRPSRGTRRPHPHALPTVLPERMGRTPQTVLCCAVCSAQCALRTEPCTTLHIFTPPCSSLYTPRHLCTPAPSVCSAAHTCTSLHLPNLVPAVACTSMQIPAHPGTSIDIPLHAPSCNLWKFMHIHAYTHTSMHIPAHPCTYLCMCIPANPRAFLHISAHPCTSMHVPVHRCTYLYIPAYTYTSMQLLFMPVPANTRTPSCIHANPYAHPNHHWTSLNLPAYLCTSLHILVHPCTSLYILHIPTYPNTPIHLHISANAHTLLGK